MDERSVSPPDGAIPSSSPTSSSSTTTNAAPRLSKKERKQRYIEQQRQRQRKRKEEKAMIEDFQWRTTATSPSADAARSVSEWAKRLNDHLHQRFADRTAEELMEIVSRAVSLRDQPLQQDYVRFLRRHPSAKQINEMWKGKGAEGVKGMGYKVLMMKNKNKDKNKNKNKNKDKEKDKDKNKKNKKNKNKNKNNKNKKNKNKNNNINSNGCCSSHYPVQVGNAGRAYYRTPDDRIYLQHPELQEYLPRGIVFCESDDGEVELVLFSNRKFYGKSNGDDDDSDLTSRTLRDGNFSHFIISEKANGESLYQKVDAYGYAREIAESFFDYLALMGKEKEESLRQFLLLTRLTVNFELESPQHQHLVLLTERKLVLIGLTGVHVVGRSVYPMLSAAFAAHFGFPSVFSQWESSSSLATSSPSESSSASSHQSGESNDKDCRVVVVDPPLLDKSALGEHSARIHTQWGREGAVFVLLDESMRVVDLVKVKCWWYVLLRAIREKVKMLQRGVNLSRVCSLIVSRLRVLKTAMNVPQDYVQLFQTLGVSFAKYIQEDERRLFRLSEDYPLFWDQFLTHNNLPLDNQLLNTTIDLRDASASLSTKELPLLVMMQGIPGVGKSRLSAAVARELSKNGIPAKSVAQDDFVHLGKKKSGEACCKAVKEMLLSGVRVVFLARNNATQRQYGRYLQLDTDGLCRIAFLRPAELDDRGAELVYLGCCSVLTRKREKEEHPTNQLADNQLATLPLSFYAEMERPRRALLYHCMQHASLAIPDVELFSSLLSTASKSPRNFSLNKEHLEKLLLHDEDRTLQIREKYHRNTEETVAEIVPQIMSALKLDIPPFGSYLAAVLSTEDSEALTQTACKEATATMGNDWTMHTHHVTFMHSSDFFRNPSLWSQLTDKIGKRVEISPTALMADRRMVAVRVSMRMEVEGREATEKDAEEEKKEEIECVNADELVFSGHPHVTVACAPKTSAFMAASLLQQCKQEDLVELAMAPFVSVLTLCESEV